MQRARVEVVLLQRFEQDRDVALAIAKEDAFLTFSARISSRSTSRFCQSSE